MPSFAVNPAAESAIAEMGLTKADLISALRHNGDGYTIAKATHVVETILDLIKESLTDGESVRISRFGKFEVKEKRRRLGRNPATGDDLMLDARKVVTFKWSGKLRDRLNGG